MKFSDWAMTFVLVVAISLLPGCDGQADPDLNGQAGADAGTVDATSDGTQTGDQSATGMQTLPIEYPEATYKETPKNIPPQLKAIMEPPRKGLPVLPQVPEGVVNLALNKPVTASLDFSDNMMDFGVIVDGKKKPDEFVSFMVAEPVWLQIDLGKSCPIHAIAIWHDFSGQGIVYHDVIVQVSDDPQFKRDVTTVFNNDHDNSSGLGVGKDRAYWEEHFGKIIETGGTRARYVRCYSKGSTISSSDNRCIEVEVWGLEE